MDSVAVFPSRSHPAIQMKLAVAWILIGLFSWQIMLIQMRMSLCISHLTIPIHVLRGVRPPMCSWDSLVDMSSYLDAGTLPPTLGVISMSSSCSRLSLLEKGRKERQTTESILCLGLTTPLLNVISTHHHHARSCAQILPQSGKRVDPSPRSHPIILFSPLSLCQRSIIIHHSFLRPHRGSPLRTWNSGRRLAYDSLPFPSPSSAFHQGLTSSHSVMIYGRVCGFHGRMHRIMGFTF